MDLERAYKEIADRITTIDFTRLWRGFESLRFALYDGQKCFFDGEYIEQTDDFVANTAILYNGAYIAIWRLTEAYDQDVLASKLVHEMFHGFQLQNDETRFMDELEALQKYVYDGGALTAKLEENRLICTLLDKFDETEYSRLIALRRCRYERFPYEYRYEVSVEQIEGSANYVELAALRQLSGDKYASKLGSMRAEILDPANFLPIRIIGYSIGALLLTLIKTDGLLEFEANSDKPFALELIESAHSGCELPPADPAVIACIDKYNEKTAALINRALTLNDVAVEGDYELLGVNVYDTRRMGNYIVTTYSAAYSDGDGHDNYLDGDFVAELNEKGRLVRLYRLDGVE